MDRARMNRLGQAFGRFLQSESEHHQQLAALFQEQAAAALKHAKIASATKVQLDALMDAINQEDSSEIGSEGAGILARASCAGQGDGAQAASVNRQMISNGDRLEVGATKEEE
ncbi:hypothetical protein JCM3765_003611 [Sporobolomyces pararoseus]